MMSVFISRLLSLTHAHDVSANIALQKLHGVCVKDFLNKVTLYPNYACT